ncbi:MAG TPA: TlpA disulfide reductase family protein [Bacteroidia bacterium]|nr:TlpA disulfide reductase family protein [Bacteroidia bacterium]
MKYIIPFMLFSAGLFSQPKDFTLTADIKGAPEGSYMYLGHKLNDAFMSDSAKVTGEKAVFKGKTPEPNMYWITPHKNENPTLIFFIDGGKVEITGKIDSLAKAVVKAGKTQEDYKASIALANAFFAKRQGFIARHNGYMQTGNAIEAKKILDSAQIEERAYAKNLIGFIKQHPASNVGGYIIFSVQFDWPQIPEFDEMYNALSDKVKKGKFGKLALDKVNSLKGTTVGYPALDFTLPDVNGKNVSLSSYKGKYVLVDFWASWCGPCRKENPAVVSAYNKYKDKGFDILAVSLDDNKDKWIAAIQKDGLTWTHVSDLKGWQSAVGKMYGVTSIPFNLLLDKDGKILAKSLRGADLEAKLGEVLK